MGEFLGAQLFKAVRAAHVLSTGTDNNLECQKKFDLTLKGVFIMNRRYLLTSCNSDDSLTSLELGDLAEILSLSLSKTSLRP